MIFVESVGYWPSKLDILYCRAPCRRLSKNVPQDTRHLLWVENISEKIWRVFLPTNINIHFDEGYCDGALSSYLQPVKQGLCCFYTSLKQNTNKNISLDIRQTLIFFLYKVIHNCRQTRTATSQRKAKFEHVLHEIWDHIHFRTK